MGLPVDALSIKCEIVANLALDSSGSLDIIFMVTRQKLRGQAQAIVPRVNRLTRSSQRSWLRDVYRFADHQTAVQGKQQDNRVEFQGSALGKETQGNVLVSPVLRHPVGHERGDGQSSRDRGALKVPRLAALILRENRNGDIESSQSSQTTENEKGQEQVIEGCPNTKGKGGGSGSETKGNLHEHTPG